MWRRFFLGFVGGTMVTAMASVVLQAQELRPEGEYVMFGFSTVEWGKDWDLLQLVENVQEVGVRHVELAVDQANGVALAQTAEQRTSVREQLQDAELETLGLKTEVIFGAGELEAVVEQTKQQLRLSHDIGGSGVRVKLGELKGEAAAIAAVAKALSGLGEFAVGFGQEIRVEVEAGKGSVADAVKLLKEVNHDQVKAAFVLGSAEVSGKEVEETLKQLQGQLGSLVVIGLQEEAMAEAYDALAKWLVEVDFIGVVALSSKAENADKSMAMGQQKVLWEQRMKKARTK